jgi:acyl transferase domain-containing protein/4'-phosphopantetheinyl transferase EntD
MDCVFPGARDLAAFWRNIVRGVDATSEVPLSRWGAGAAYPLPTARGGFIDGLTEVDPVALGVMPAAVEEGDPEQFLVLAVVHRALLDAQWGRLRLGRRAPLERNVPAPGLWFLDSPDRTEVVIGRGGYLGNTMELGYLRMEVVAQVADMLRRLSPDLPDGSVEEIRRVLTEALPPANSEATASAIPNLTAGRAANRLGLMGANYTVDAACASSLLAVDQIIRSLREGRSDLGIVAGVHLVQKPHFWLAFATLGALSRTGRVRAFSGEADGLLIGEGVGAVVLKRLADAERDGDRIYALIRGTGSSSDGRGAGVMTPRVEGEVLAMRRAYADAGIDPATVSLLEGHGTATVVGDATEIESLHQLFGREGYPALALGSVKSMIGHTMPAAGIASLIKTALAVYHRVLPPTLHAGRAHPALDRSRIYLNTATRPWIAPPEDPRRAGINAFGFGGINAHLILEEGPEVRVAESLMPRSTELVLIAAEDRQSLLGRLEECARLAAGGNDTDLSDVAAAQAEGFSHERPVRMAIVASSMDDLAVKLAAARRRISSGAEEVWFDPHGVGYSSRGLIGRVAFLFPGIGFPGLAGGYAGRLAELCLHFPDVRRHIDFADALTRSDGPEYPLRHQLFPPPSLLPAELWKLEKELAWSERTPAGMMLANQATWSLMSSLGFRPDAIAGFSLGEWSALMAGGVLEPDDLIRLRRAIDADSTRADLQLSGTWAMVAGSAEQVEPMLRQIPGASLTMDVSPTQVFIGGETTAVRSALARLQKAGIWGQELPFPPIHTTLGTSLVERLKPLVSGIAVRPARFAVYAGMNGRRYPDDPEQIRETILEGIRSPVRVRDTIRALYADGVRVFVQLGSGGKLLTNIQNTLALDPHAALSFDLEGRGGLEQLHHLLGRMAVLGVPFLPDALFRRHPRRGPAAAAGPSARRVLALAPPRLRLSAEGIDRLRQLLTPVPEAAPVPVETHTAGSRGPGSTGSRGPAPTGSRVPVEDAIGVLEDFLRLQQRHEEDEATLMSRFLDAQRAAVGTYLQRRGDTTGHTRSGRAPDGVRSEGNAERRAAVPLVGMIEHLVPGRAMRSRLVLDLDEHLFLADHALVRAPATLRPVEELLPTLPLTVGVEILGRAAAVLVPEMRVTGWRDVKATRMVTLQDVRALALQLEAVRLSETEVQVALIPHGQGRPALTGVVLFGHVYPEPPRAEGVEIDRPCPHRAEQLYSEGRMFHGPRFQTVAALLGMAGEDGIVADLVARDPQELCASPVRESAIYDAALADGLGQVAGYKAQLDGWVVYPIGFDRLTLYGAPPAPGSTVRAQIRCRRGDTRTFEADIQALDGSGSTWLRIERWRTWRMMWPARLQEVGWRPAERSLAAPLDAPAGSPAVAVFRIHRDELGDIDPEWVARAYLVGEEWARFRQAPRLDYLLGRIAAKDALRHWIRSRWGRSLHPLEVEIASGPGGPVVASPANTPLAVSIAHVADEGIAVVAEGARVGVDLAKIIDRGPGFVATVFDAEEAAMLREAGGETNVWVHRAWCAREAAAKAAGVGLDSLPAFRVRGIRPEEGTVAVVVPGGLIVPVHTRVEGDRAIAVAVVGNGPGEDLQAN